MDDWRAWAEEQVAEAFKDAPMLDVTWPDSGPDSEPESVVLAYTAAPFAQVTWVPTKKSSERLDNGWDMLFT